MVLVDSADTTRVQLPQFEQSYEKQQPKQEEHSTEPIEPYNALTIHRYILYGREIQIHAKPHTHAHETATHTSTGPEKKNTVANTYIPFSHEPYETYSHTHSLSSTLCVTIIRTIHTVRVYCLNISDGSLTYFKP